MDIQKDLKMPEQNIEVSVVLPCLNEEKTIGICLRKIKEVLAQERINAEMIVVDNGSTDRSAEVARGEGAKVIFHAQRGYGAAYRRGLREAKGQYIIIADSDNTYDFYQIPKFLQPLKNDYDVVIGSRFRGGIKKGAMHWSHRYLGNPFLSALCRFFFHTKLSDINCGMRSFNKESLRRMRLVTDGMEFATEMVVSALTNNLRICEVSVDYHPRQGKSKLNPLFDAWRHLRFMLFYCPLWLYFIPGSAGLFCGGTLLFLLWRGPFLFLGHRWDLHLMVFASVLTILSYQILHLGVYAHTFAIKKGILRLDRLTLFLLKHFTLERGIVLGGAVFLLGFMIVFFIFIEWFFKNFGPLYRIREAILAMTFLVIGLQTVFSSFFVSFLLLVEGNNAQPEK